MSRKDRHIWVRVSDELAQRLEREAFQNGLDLSTQVRFMLEREFGLLRIERDGRNRSYREAAVRGSIKARRNYKAAHAEG
jgi:hypothetical protein